MSKKKEVSKKPEGTRITLKCCNCPVKTTVIVESGESPETTARRIGWKHGSGGIHCGCRTAPVATKPDPVKTDEPVGSSDDD